MTVIVRLNPRDYEKLWTYSGRASFITLNRRDILRYPHRTQRCHESRDATSEIFIALSGSPVQQNILLVRIVFCILMDIVSHLWWNFNLFRIHVLSERLLLLQQLVVAIVPRTTHTGCGTTTKTNDVTFAFSIPSLPRWPRVAAEMFTDQHSTSISISASPQRITTLQRQTQQRSSFLSFVQNPDRNNWEDLLCLIKRFPQIEMLAASVAQALSQDFKDAPDVDVRYEFLDNALVSYKN